MVENFNFFLPADFQKAKDAAGKDVFRVKGIISDNSRDSDGDELDPSNLDFSEFSFINWDHQKGPDAIIGAPISTQVVPEGVYMEGEIYPDVSAGKAAIDLMEMVERRPNMKKLGWSIEGQILSRDLITKRPKTAKVTAVALCPFPKNGNTWAALAKSKSALPIQSKDDLLYQSEVDPNGGKESEILCEFYDEVGNSLIIKKDFSIVINKAMSTESTRALIPADVEGQLKIIKKAFDAGQLSEEDLIQVYSKFSKRW